MNSRNPPRAARALFIALALVMTLATANFVDFLATDYAVGLRQTARLPAGSMMTMLNAPAR